MTPQHLGLQNILTDPKGFLSWRNGLGANEGSETVQATQRKKGTSYPRLGDTPAGRLPDSTSVFYASPLFTAKAISLLLKPRGTGRHKLISMVSGEFGQRS